MPSLDAPPPSTEARDHAVERHNARLGMILFVIYLVGYVAYVLLSAFAPQRLDAVPAGMALIGGAIVLAVIYAGLCRNPRNPTEVRP
jgi:uncharacterized membrane protein (DUF485 family)